jgi:glycine/D-amino acid oxidase-like deaminating enzyme
MSKQTYPNYKNTCGWTSLLTPRTPNAALAKDIIVDYAIIGAGFTGIAAAHRLFELDNQAKIALVDASNIDEGSSARNSGFTGAEIIPRNVKPKSAAKAMKQTHLMRESFNWLLEIIKSHGIDCDMHHVGTIRGAATDKGEASLRKVLEIAKANEITHRVLTRKDMQEHTGSDYYQFGLHFDYGHLLQPAALMRGLIDSLPQDIALYENTPVTKLSRDGDAWVLISPNGTLRAKNVILANNAFIPHLGYLKLRMTIIYTYATLTRPLTKSEQAQVGRNANWGLLPSHRLGSTIRRIEGDRIMVRSQYSHGIELDNQKMAEDLHHSMTRRWPKLSHVDFDYIWGGTTSFTMNGAPWWGKITDGLYASAGCNGSGIAKGTMLGRNLADLICNNGDPNRVPNAMGTASIIAPEPFRSIGFKIMSTLGKREAGREI